MKLWTIIDLDELAKLEYHGYIRARKSYISPIVQENFDEKKAFLLDPSRPDFRKLKYEYDMEEEKVVLELEVNREYLHSMTKKSFLEKTDKSFVKCLKGNVYFADKIQIDEVLDWKIYQGAL